MKTIEELARESSLPASISAHPAFKQFARLYAVAVRREALEEAEKACQSMYELIPYHGNLANLIGKNTAYEVAQSCAAAIRSLQSPFP